MKSQTIVTLCTLAATAQCVQFEQPAHVQTSFVQGKAENAVTSTEIRKYLNTNRQNLHKWERTFASVVFSAFGEEQFADDRELTQEQNQKVQELVQFWNNHRGEDSIIAL